MRAQVELVALERREWQELGDDPAAFATARKLRLGDQSAALREIGAGTAAFLAGAAADPRWGCYLAMDAGTGIVVGTCAYKGPPDADGAVEIAYHTLPIYEGRGYATAMAAGLTERAGVPPKAVTVRAHTLSERNASTRILEKLGFACIGQVVDPDDGPVWRWERAPGPSPDWEIRHMPAYVIVNVTIRDPARYEEYKRLATPTVSAYGGRYVARGAPVEVREGSWSPSRLVILEFPDLSRARAWWDSPEYAPAKAVRQSCAETDLVITEGLPT